MAASKKNVLSLSRKEVDTDKAEGRNGVNLKLPREGGSAARLRVFLMCAGGILQLKVETGVLPCGV